MNVLAKLKAALAADQPESLRLVLAAWKECPAPALGELIDKAPVLAIEGEIGGARKMPAAAWIEHAARKDPRAMPALLATLLDAGTNVARERLDILLGWPPDPRLELTLAKWLLAPPRTSEGALPFWGKVFDVVARFRDPRANRAVRAIRVSGAHGGIKARAMFERRLARLSKTFDDHEIDAAARQIATQIAAAWSRPGPARRADALLQAVFDHPDDDGARMVYADALQELGADPHGEFIVLQLAPKPTTEQRARIRELIAKQSARFLGPLVDVVRASDAKFERGFVASCATAPAERALVGNPWWSTVRRLDGGHPQLVTHDVMRGLRRLVIHDPLFVPAILAKPPPALRRVELQFDAHLQPGHWAAAMQALANATLDELVIRGWDYAGFRPLATDYRPLFAGPMVSKLRVLHAYTANFYWQSLEETHAIGAWLRAFREHVLPPRVELDDKYNVFAFERGKLVEIECRWGREETADPRAGLLQWAVRGARSLERSDIAPEVEITFPHGKPPGSTPSAIRRALG